MKKFIFWLVLIPIGLKAGLTSGRISTSDLVQVRTGSWPIDLERVIDRYDTSYSLQFRDQQVLDAVVMDTLPFPNTRQLKYFEEALTALRTGKNGDIAEFKDYSIKRADVRKESTWYLLRLKWGLTNFQQPEADLIVNTIRNW
jgi:hypothetical protein